MTIESHPTLHFIFILLCYNVGQFAGIAAVGYVASKSTLNSLDSIAHYFKARAVPIMLRWLLCLFLFFIVWDNPSVMNLERFMPNFMTHLGVAGLLGFTSDQIFDKVLAIIFPGIQKDLPAIPPPDQGVQG